jgi:hypothetical protein
MRTLVLAVSRGRPAVRSRALRPCRWAPELPEQAQARSKLLRRFVSTSHRGGSPDVFCICSLPSTGVRAADVGLNVGLPAHSDYNMLLFNFRRRDGAARQDRTVDLSLTKGELPELKALKSSIDSSR